MKKPRRVHNDTYIVMTDFPAAHLGILPINWFLIKAQEPVLVDTGMSIEREQFLPTLESMIDPAEIKWIFLTHDDNDHQGNIAQAMQAAPDAKLVIPFLGLARMADTHHLPMERVLLINPGQSFHAGDRELTVFKPLMWDSPATHCLYDERTGTLFSADALGALVPQPAEDMNDVSKAAYAEGCCTFARALCPWLHLVDQSKFNQHLETIKQLDPKTVLSSHGLVTHGICDSLLTSITQVPAMQPFIGPDQAEMMAIMAKMKATA